MQRFTACFLAVLALYVAGTVRAEGWSLWPSSKSTTKTAPKTGTVTSWSSGSTSAAKTDKSSKSWSETLMPWKKPAPPKSATPYGNLGRTVNNVKKEPEKKSSVSSWFLPKEEPKPAPRTLGEWMSQERLDP